MYPGRVERLNITLDAEQGAKLARLADRMHVQPGTLARSLLSSALDEADPDAATSSSARRHPGRPRAGASQARREAKSGAVAGAGPMPAC